MIKIDFANLLQHATGNSGLTKKEFAEYRTKYIRFMLY